MSSAAWILPGCTLREDLILHYGHLWPHLQAGGDSWTTLVPQRYRVYEDEALNELEVAAVKDKIWRGDRGQLYFAPGSAIISGPYDNPRVLHDEDSE